MATMRVRPISLGAKFWQAASISPAACCRPRRYSSLTPPAELEARLAQPSWSVKSLFDASSEQKPAPEITRKQLHHLLRLSALPLPKSAEEEAEMISDLQSQLKFVQAIQDVDTEGVEPLQSIRDETKEAERENEITLETLETEFAKERTVGKRGRIVREKEERKEEKEVDWDPLAQAPRKFGRFFAVDTARD